MIEAALLEWGGLLIRWAHIITGIAWIGSSFYFMHMDAAIRATPDLPADKGGEAWEVHGGGFYQVRKYLVAPDFLPDHLIWHKWEAYATWITGFFLLVWIYYLSADLYLIDPDVMAMSPWVAAGLGMAGLAAGWLIYDQLCKSGLGANDTHLSIACFVLVVAAAYGFQSVFSGRGALIHTGAFMATIMSANVFFVIIPNQRLVVADLVAGRAPDPALGEQAKQRSAHNNYLTLPVLFLMLSGHYPLTFSTPYAFVIVALVLVAGALIRVYFNHRNAGKGELWWTWGVAAVCLAAAAAISLSSTPTGRQALAIAPKIDSGVPVEAARVPDEVTDIVAGRCSMCHAGQPAYTGIAMPPNGVLLDTPEAVARHARAIYLQSVLTTAMPPNNVSGMTLAERRQIAAWVEGRGRKNAQ